jgi:nitrate reductase assembly molybdenum cofactor insertion protein NarJ
LEIKIIYPNFLRNILESEFLRYFYMHFDFDRQLLSLAFRFYSRALSFPYDELIHELHYIFREAEKCIESDLDNTIAAKILDVINFYQGEEMSALHAEYARMFSYVREAEPLVPIRLLDINPGIDQFRLMEEINASTNLYGADDAPDALPNILELFSTIIELDDDHTIEDFFESFLKNSIPSFCEQIFQSTNINYYKELAKGLNEMIYLLREDS